MSCRICNHLAEDGISRNTSRFRSNFRRRRLPTTLNCRPKMAHRVRNLCSNSLRIYYLPATPKSLILCADFRLSPLMFSIFYERGGGERGRGYHQNANGPRFGSRLVNQ